jgi:hypothetical protein
MGGLLCGRAIGASRAPKTRHLEPLLTRSAEKGLDVTNADSLSLLVVVNDSGGFDFD